MQTSDGMKTPVAIGGTCPLRLVLPPFTLLHINLLIIEKFLFSVVNANVGIRVKWGGILFVVSNSSKC